MITKEEIEQIKKALNMPEQHGSYEKHHNIAEQILDRLDKVVRSSNVIHDVSNCSKECEWKADTFDNIGVALTEYCEECGVKRDCG